MTTLSLRHYLVVTGSYWAFTVTDGALRMLVVLHFHALGYTPFEVAMLFLFYEFFGIVTNLAGGWLAAHSGLKLTLFAGMLLQIVALLMLTVPDPWLTVAYVMLAQALSGIAKDLNKMSAKASVKVLAGTAGESRLFTYVAALTGSKNALKGGGFFIGAALLDAISFRNTLMALVGLLIVALLLAYLMLPISLGAMKVKPKFRHLFSKRAEINWLSAARFFLFGARDVWFVVGLPVFLYAVLGWSFTDVGTFFAVWVIGYGVVQATAPALFGRIGTRNGPGHGPGRAAVSLLTLLLASVPVAIVVSLGQGWDPERAVVGGLILFGVIFAVNSALHSYLILAYSDIDKVALNVGFYYMANAGGRLAGTLLSGWVYQAHGLIGCLWWSAAFLIVAALMSLKLPTTTVEVTSHAPG